VTFHGFPQSLQVNDVLAVLHSFDSPLDCTRWSLSTLQRMIYPVLLMPFFILSQISTFFSWSHPVKPSSGDKSNICATSDFWDSFKSIQKNTHIKMCVAGTVFLTLSSRELNGHRSHWTFSCIQVLLHQIIVMSSYVNEDCKWTVSTSRTLWINWMYLNWLSIQKFNSIHHLTDFQQTSHKNHAIRKD
jgi:hypothetical protein